MIHNIRDYGAVGDGICDDTSAIRSAIEACFEAGGGQVLLPGGFTYRAGTVILRSNIDFHIEEGAVLKASDDLNAFDLKGNGDAARLMLKLPTYDSCEYSGCPSLYFLYANDGENISISGKGIIDGNEEIFYGDVTPEHIDGSFYPRVPMFFLENVRHLSISDITLRRSAFWTVHMVGCRYADIRNIRILNSRRFANCDGIDPDHCSDVRITGCHIESADDCIVFKNTEYGEPYGACENITVEDCDLSSTSSAIKFGTESWSEFRNITVKRCRITDSNRGISLQLRDNGSIDNVSFTDISIDTHYVSREHWWGDGEPIAITALRRHPGYDIGCISNIRFKNISCSSENGILIYSEEQAGINGISFENVTVSLRERKDDDRSGYDLRPCDTIPYAPAPHSDIFIWNAIGITACGCSFEV